MKVSSMCIMVILPILLVSAAMPAWNLARSHPSQGDYGGFAGRTPSAAGLIRSNVVEPNLELKRRPERLRGADTLQIAGSRLPDCSHACGSCSPCLLVMVSLKCALLAEAETCPLAYKCICNSKSFPVP